MALEIFFWSFNAVAPLLFAMMLGWFIAFRGHIEEDHKVFLNRLCFKYLMPLHLFANTYSIDFDAYYNPRLVIYCCASIVFVTIAAWIVFTFLVSDRQRRAIFIISTFRTNNLAYGLALAGNLFGAAGITAAVMVYPVSIVTFNVLGVAVFVYFSQDGKGVMSEILKNTFIDIIKNPLIVACLMGTLCAVFHIPIPQSLQGGLTSSAAAATPIGLLLLGAQIDLKSLTGNLKPALAMCFIRLLLVPAVVITVMVFAGFRGPELSAMMVAFSAPPAVTNMVMARNYNIAPDFAAQTVYLCSILSIVTLFAIIVLLRGMGFM